MAAILERGLKPHIPLLAGAEMEEVPKWQRRTLDLGQMRARKQKVREAVSPTQKMGIAETVEDMAGLLWVRSENRMWFWCLRCESGR